ncbi:hypothetical protein Q9L58_010787, partial [Maublancomyces gigas]
MPPKGKGIQVPATPKQKSKKQQQPKTPLLRLRVELSPERRAQHEENYMTPSNHPKVHQLEPDGTTALDQHSGLPVLTREAYTAYLNGTPIQQFLGVEEPSTPSTFKGPADNRPSPDTPTRKRKTNPPHTSTTPSDDEYPNTDEEEDHR